MLDGGEYVELDPETVRSLDNKYNNWRSDSGGVAERYAMLGDLLIPHPYVDEDITNGFLVYFFQRPATMSDGTHYPFHIPESQTTERSDLAILSDSVLEYAEWKILKVLNKRDDAYQKFNEYLQNLEMIRPLIQIRSDITSHDGTKFQGPQVGG